MFFRKGEFWIGNQPIVMYKKLGKNVLYSKNFCPICKISETKNNNNNDNNNNNESPYFNYIYVHPECLDGLVKCSQLECSYYFNKTTFYNTRCGSCKQITCHSHQIRCRCLWCYFNRKYLIMWVIKEICPILYNVPTIMKYIIDYESLSTRCMFIK